MTKANSEIRYAYVKNGDVVAQMERMAAAPGEISSGPDAFLSDFLCRSANGPVMLISRLDRNIRRTDGVVDARVFSDGIGALNKIWRRPLASVKIFLDLVHFRPDRIVCSSSGGGVMWATFAAARYLSVPFVHSRHGRVLHDDERWSRRLGAWIDSWFIRHSDRVICHGPYLSHQLLQLGVPEDHLFEFDVRFDDLLADPAMSRAGRREEEFSKSEKTILFVGRMEVRKGVTDLLEASSDLMARDPSIRLVYAGVGAHLLALRERVERLEFAGRIAVLGEVPHHEIAALMANCAVVVAPTRKGFPEGRCMVVMEAMLVGVPVIAPEFGPFPFLVRHRINGLLYEPDSVAGLRGALDNMLSDPNVHEALAQGACATGIELRDPPMTFSQAVNGAFEDMDTHRAPGQSGLERSEEDR